MVLDLLKNPYVHLLASCASPILGVQVAAAVAAKGLLDSVLEDFCIHRCSGKPKYGSVVFCNRYVRLYRHFGIYIGYGKVIHFAAANGDFDAKTARIRETTLKQFCKGADIYEMDFSKGYKNCRLWRYIVNSSDYELQSPRKTAARAKLLLGKKGVGDRGYHLAFNNCEHFALWCKTNVAESKQVNKIIDSIIPGL